MRSLPFAVVLHDPNLRPSMEELCERLSTDAGVPVEPFLASSPSRMALALVEQRALLAWMSPTLMLMSPQLQNMVPLLSSVRQGAAFFHSVLFTAEDSPLQRIEDLDRARAAWVAPTSASGYLVPKLTLSSLGIDLRKAFAREEFFDSHGAVARAVLADRTADVGATYAGFERGDASGALLRAGYMEVGLPRARILVTSGPIPADMIVAHPSITIPERVAFAGALCRLAQTGHDALRAVIGADDFRAVTHDALGELQRLMESAAAEDAV
jgi:phosphonate transport system substrate-binding protein